MQKHKNSEFYEVTVLILYNIADLWSTGWYELASDTIYKPVWPRTLDTAALFPGDIVPPAPTRRHTAGQRSAAK